MAIAIFLGITVRLSISNKEGNTYDGRVNNAPVFLCINILWCDFVEPENMVCLSLYCHFAFLGFIDDKAKRDNKSADGGASRIVKNYTSSPIWYWLGCCSFFPTIWIFFRNQWAYR